MALSSYLVFSQACYLSFSISQDLFKLIDIFFGSNDASKTLSVLFGIAEREIFAKSGQKESTRQVMADLLKTMVLYAFLQNTAPQKGSERVPAKSVCDVTVCLQKDRLDNDMPSWTTHHRDVSYEDQLADGMDWDDSFVSRPRARIVEDESWRQPHLKSNSKEYRQVSYPGARKRSFAHEEACNGAFHESGRRKRKASTNTNLSQSGVSIKSSLWPASLEDSSAISTERATLKVDYMEQVIKITKYMRYSAASYGWHFLRMTGMAARMPNVASGSTHHANHHAFSAHARVKLEDILLSSYTPNSSSTASTLSPKLVYYVSVDHEARSIVLSCRGTLGLSDLVTDLICDYAPLDLYDAVTNSQRRFSVHRGILVAAKEIAEKDGRVHRTLRLALEQYQSYKLVLAGHSLGICHLGFIAQDLLIYVGGGVASLVSLLWAIRTPAEDGGSHHASNFVTSLRSGLPAGRPIHCYTYGCPAVVSPHLREHTIGLVTSVVRGNDSVPSLSLGILGDMKSVALAFKEDPSSLERVRRILLRSVFLTGTMSTDDECFLLCVWKNLKATMGNRKLLPPGEVYIIESEETLVECTQHKIARNGQGPRHRGLRIELKKCIDVEGRFGELLFAKDMLSSHHPRNYDIALRTLEHGLRL